MACVLCACAPREALVTLTDLRCELAKNPIGIDAARPRLGWILESPERNQTQAAYQIVATDGAGHVLWDSGKVTSAESAHIEWGGLALRSGQRVTWRARVWDRLDRPSRASALASFEMGLLRPIDWQPSKWIGSTGRFPYSPEIPVPDGRWIWSPDGAGAKWAPKGERLLRHVFTLPDDAVLKSARALFFSAHDKLRWVLYVNGKEATRGGGLSGFVPTDVAALLKPGANLLAVTATNPGGAAAILGRLTVERSDGRLLAIDTTTTWKTSQKKWAGWNQPGFDDAGWDRARDVASAGFAPWGRVALPSNAPPAPLLRKTFGIGKPVASARAYVSGLGYFELFINGKRIGDHVLDPGFTRYDRRVLYVTHDVTSAVREGANAIAVILGNGWYSPHAQDVWGFHRAPWKNPPRLLLQLRVRYADGSEETIASDDSWKTTAGPIVFDGIRNGETYDARREKPGFADAKVSDADWRPVVVVSAPGGVMSAQSLPMKVTETVRARRVSEPRPGVFVVDFGQNLAGWARLHVAGPAGTEVRLRYGELLNSDGTIDQRAIAEGVQQGPVQTDTYVLKGEGNEVYEPRFTYHGFSHVEVTGFPGRPNLDSLQARVVHTAFERTGNFETSSEVVNRIQRATLWSYRSNFPGIPTDSPSRGKIGATAGAHLAAEQAMFNFGNAAGYEKWLHDLADEQLPDGELPAFAPSPGVGASRGNGPAWDSAFVLIPWYLYLHTGDPRALTSGYDGLHRTVDYVGSHEYARANPAGWKGDVMPFHDRTPEWVTHAGYHAADARIVALAARLAGKNDEATRYEAMAAEVRRSFEEAFFDEQGGDINVRTQTALGCALFQELVPEGRRARVLETLLSNIARHNDHIDTGLLGARCLLHALSDMGRADLAYRLASGTDNPGWGNFMKRGATTLWEGWAGDGAQNNVALGDISAWFWKTLAGINPNPKAPGFAHVIIRPEPVGDLTWVRAETHTVRGKIASSWQRDKHGALGLKVEIPVGSTATVLVPASDRAQVTTDGAVFVRAEKSRRIYQTGSGTWSFEVREKLAP